MGQNARHPVSILPLWRRAVGQPEARVAALAPGRGSSGTARGQRGGPRCRQVRARCPGTGTALWSGHLVCWYIQTRVRSDRWGSNKCSFVLMAFITLP